MDKSWIRKSRLSKEYFDGVNDFLNFAFEKSSQDGKILCPCSRCSNINWHTREIVKEHLVCNGFLLGYTHWACHGESISSSSSSSNTTYHLQDPSRLRESTHDQMGSSRHDDMEGLLRDALRMYFQDSNNSSSREDIPNVQNIRAESNEHCDIGLDRQEPTDEPNIGASNFYKLLEDGKQELYPGCTKFSKLSFIVHLFHLKCLNGWSSKSFTMLLELLNDAFPNGTTLPKSTYDAKKFIKDLGLGYEKINSCPNDCILYWGDRSNEQSCDVCGASRWLSTATENASNDEMGNEDRKGRPANVLRYFSLIPRLQRLFMSPKTSDYMRWHDEGRTKDGLLRHPADSLAWRSFDSRYKDFSSDSRNVRLGATDGFNPFRAMNTSYSMWPVILIPYNLPPWICMKQSSFILSMIIPGPKGPGNNIDVYLQPLIEELNQLWKGVDTYDASRKDNFHMRATLLWTISDFPAYANLSGWSTKGRYACPCCVDKTCSRWLYNGKKFCYMGHRRWLSETHKFRYQKHLFDGTEELRSAPTPISGTNVLKQVEGINFRYGKVPYSARNKASINTQSKKRMKKQFDNSQDHESQSYNLEAIRIKSDGDEDEDDFNNISLWKKKSIFFMLPYWKHNLLRHNIDMMHTEKNVGENVCGTVLNEDGKSKDNVKSRLDLVDMDIRHELHPQLLPNGKTYLPFACYSLSTEEKDVFCKVLKDIKVPDGFASNISRCVNLKEHRLLSLKSHDYHILMQDLLPLALRASMTTEVASILIELSNIFKAICSKVLNVEDLEQLQHRTAITLCHLEKIFPPSFFTIMVHLIIHLPEEAKLGGPVHYRWMYPIERNLFKLKSHVRNKAHPEGSIAEEYLVEECLLFCSRYLEGVETRFNRPARNYDIVRDEHSIPYLFLTAGQPIGQVDVITLDEMAWAQAHRYMLFHHNMVEPFRNEYIRILRARSRPRRLQNHEIDRLLIEQFHEWFGDHISSQSDVADEVRWLAREPNKIAKRYKGFIINGFRFHTKDRERNKRTQNSGIVVTSSIRSYATAKDTNPLEGNVDYYGMLTDIIELDYYGKFRVVLFRCDWADVTSSRGVRKDQFGFTTVNFSRLIHTGEQLKHEPFVFSSQVKQVFYSQDPKNVDWYVVLHKAPRDLFDMGEKSNDEDFEVHNECMPFADQHLDENFENWARLDVAEDIHSN